VSKPLKLGGVERIVAYCSPSNVRVKPSEFEPGSRITLADLEDWPHGAVEVHLAINSPQAESMRRLADHRFEWVLPGHGQRVRLPAGEMRAEVLRLAESMSR
jgi:hypothetical protein